MKILIVGQGKSAYMAAVVARFKELYPDAEIVTQESLMNQLPADSAPQRPVVFFDELSDMSLTCPVEAAVPAKEKVMHPWSRRKKR